MKDVYKQDKNTIVFDPLQAIANIYEYNRSLGAKY